MLPPMQGVPYNPLLSYDPRSKDGNGTEENPPNECMIPQQEEFTRNSTPKANQEKSKAPPYPEEFTRNFTRIANYQEPEITVCDHCIEKSIKTYSDYACVCTCCVCMTTNMILPTQLCWATKIASIVATTTFSAGCYFCTKKQYQKRHVDKKFNRAFSSSYQNYLKICAVRDRIKDLFESKVTFIILEYAEGLKLDNHYRNLDLPKPLDFDEFIKHDVLDENECREAYKESLTSYYISPWWRKLKV